MNSLNQQKINNNISKLNLNTILKKDGNSKEKKRTVFKNTIKKKFSIILNKNQNMFNKTIFTQRTKNGKDFFIESKIKKKGIRKRCKINIPVILIGNKLDKENERAVSRKEALDLSYKEKYKYKETSCKTNANVDNAFETLIGLWILEERKKNLVGERFNSYEIRKLKKRETGDTNISSRKNSIIVGTRRDNSFFIDSKHKKTSKKKCEC